MAILEIITYPEPLLNEVSEEVTDFGDATQTLIDDMAETMFDAPGAGLAAVQVGVAKKIIVVNTTPSPENEEDKPEPSWYPLVNPEIVKMEGSFLSEDEGCLSVPELRGNVKRASLVRVEAQDRNGNPITINADGFEAVVLQHEIDHLEGTLFFEHLSALKRNLYKKKVKKLFKDKK